MSTAPAVPFKARIRLEATSSFQAAYILPHGRERTRLMQQARCEQEAVPVETVVAVGPEHPGGVPVWRFASGSCVMANANPYEPVSAQATQCPSV